MELFFIGIVILVAHFFLGGTLGWAVIITGGFYFAFEMMSRYTVKSQKNMRDTLHGIAEERDKKTTHELLEEAGMIDEAERLFYRQHPDAQHENLQDAASRALDGIIPDSPVDNSVIDQDSLAAKNARIGENLGNVIAKAMEGDEQGNKLTDDQLMSMLDTKHRD